MLNRLIAVFALVTAAFAQPVLADAAPLSGAFPLLVTPYTAETRLDITTPVMRLDVAPQFLGGLASRRVGRDDDGMCRVDGDGGHIRTEQGCQAEKQNGDLLHRVSPSVAFIMP